MLVIKFLLVSYILLSISLYKVFEKAGEDGWKALIPGYNFIVWCKLIGRPAWWAALLLIPVVNIFIAAGMNVDLVRSFGKYDFKDAALAVIYAPISFFLIGFNKEDKYVGPTLTLEKAYAAQMEEASLSDNSRELKKLQFNNPYKKSILREWTEAIVFAVFAAAFIRMFFIEPYLIPTSSMEGSLNVGDFLFVSKAHYGMRMPQTLLQLPLVFNTIPVIGSESYLNNPQLEYKRLPAIEPVQRNHPFVFNYPEGDSIYVTPGRNFSVHDVRRNPGIKARTNGKKLRIRPIDKRDNYVKRCIGLPGDKLEIKNRQVYIDDKPAINPTNVQFNYRFISSTPVSTKNFRDWGISPEDIGTQANRFPPSITTVDMVLNQGQIDKLKAQNPSVKIVPYAGYKLTSPEPISEAQYKSWGLLKGQILQNQPNSQVFILKDEEVKNINADTSGLFKLAPISLRGGTTFPHDPKNFNWTVDNFGPIVIPKAGATVTITPNNLALYRRLISVYENNKVEVKNGRIFINDKQVTQYTFKQNYYWAMGDNRHNSEDSRFWGFVPEDHIVGKPLFIWFSTKEGNMMNGINWDRIFTSAHKM